jgi:hypothetical protein
MTAKVSRDAHAAERWLRTLDTRVEVRLGGDEVLRPDREPLLERVRVVGAVAQEAGHVGGSLNGGLRERSKICRVEIQVIPALTRPEGPSDTGIRAEVPGRTGTFRLF